MQDEMRFEVSSDENGARLDVVLAAHLEIGSRSVAQRLIEGGDALLNCERARPSGRVKSGDIVSARLDTPVESVATPEDIPLTVLYEDGDMAVIDKPAGLVVHPAAGHRDGTLANALAHRFPATRSVGDRIRPGIVHRLDKDTSGLMLVALSSRGLESLQHQIATREALREYLALCRGTVEPENGRIEAPIGRDPENRKRMAAYGLAARPAQTSYRTRERFPGFTFAEARLHTGRTHQIRVHFAALGHPLAGDDLYHGPRIEGLQRQFLHAYRLTVKSPRSGQEVQFESALPSDLQGVLEALRGD